MLVAFYSVYPDSEVADVSVFVAATFLLGLMISCVGGVLFSIPISDIEIPLRLKLFKSSFLN